MGVWGILPQPGGSGANGLAPDSEGAGGRTAPPVGRQNTRIHLNNEPIRGLKPSAAKTNWTKARLLPLLIPWLITG